MHPDLMHASILAAIVTLPENAKRQLVSKLPERRSRSEDIVAASIMVALAQRF